MSALSSALSKAVRDRPVLAGFTAAYLFGLVVVGISAGSALAVPYFLVVGVLVVAVVKLDERFALGGGVLWALSGWGLAHMAGGIVPLAGDRVLYNLWLVPGLIRYDQAVHAVGFAYATVACAKVMRHWLQPEPAPVASVVVAALAGMGIGALNEVVEFMATLVLDETNVGGFDNTGWDLVFNLFGTVAAASWLAVLGPARRAAEGPSS